MCEGCCLHRVRDVERMFLLKSKLFVLLRPLTFSIEEENGRLAHFDQWRNSSRRSHGHERERQHLWRKKNKNQAEFFYCVMLLFFQSFLAPSFMQQQERLLSYFQGGICSFPLYCLEGVISVVKGNVTFLSFSLSLFSSALRHYARLPYNINGQDLCQPY